MAMIDWFRRLAGIAAADAGDTEAPATGDRNAEIAGLNFMTAIDAHMKWKTRLEQYIDGRSEEDLQADVVARDDRCSLGQWIYGSGGERYADIDAFAEMKRCHADFHRCAGQVLTAAQAGDKSGALGLLQRGDYVRASERVKMQLAKLFVQLDERRRSEP